MNSNQFFSMLGGDPYDPSRMAETLKSLYVAGIDTGRAIRDTEAKQEAQAAYGAGFKQGFDEGKRQSAEKIAQMAQELLELRKKPGRKPTKKGNSKKANMRSGRF